MTATQPGLLAWHHAMYAVLLLIGASGIAGLWFGYRRGWLSVAGREADEDAPSSDIAEADLLSNEEQVLQLIEANGGRMKQKRVAEELDWTAAKTSQVTSGLRESGDLEGFRLGRENVLRLPDVDPEDPTE